MISYNSLGKHGRLGNQMFQYAALKGIAKNRGFDYTIPFSSGMDRWNDHQLFEAFTMYNCFVGNGKGPMISEKFFHFDKDLFNNCPDDADLHGYFQSHKYFNHVRDELIEDFTFKNKYNVPNHSYVAVHVRRGDYVNQPDFHPTCSLDYYREAMSKFDHNTNFVVLSDDIEWCKQQKLFNNCSFSENTNNIEDLYLMTQASHNIIANSSFSWWGAYLNNNNGIVICPKNWFGVNYSNYNMDDLRPEEWIQL
jgi:hypothetical protein